MPDVSFPWLYYFLFLFGPADPLISASESGLPLGCVDDHVAGIAAMPGMACYVYE